MKIIITGGAGFIGSHLVETLSEKAEVKVIDNLSSGKLENIKPFLDKIKFVEGDILDLEFLKEEFLGYDYLIHLAASIEVVSKSFEQILDINKINVEGTLKVLIAAKEAGIKRVVFASSCAVYGNQERGIENAITRPISPYASTKLIGENYCNFFNGVGLEIVNLRFFNVYGKRQNLDYAAVIPTFINLIKQEKQPIVYGNGKQTRDFVYVKDVVEACILAIEKEEAAGETFNIAAGKSITILELIDVINKILDKDIKPIFKDSRKGDIIKSSADTEKAKKILGFEAKYNLEQGIRDILKNE